MAASPEDNIIASTMATQGEGLTVEQRRAAIRQLLDALANKSAARSIFKTDDALGRAVTALKLLGRNPQGSEDLASESGIATLLELAGLGGSLSGGPSTALFTQPILLTHVSEAIRCLANVALLHEQARVRLASNAKLAQNLLALLGPSSIPLSTQFLLSRVLFLATVSGSEIIVTLVENMNISTHFSQRISRLSDTLLHDKDAAARTLADTVLNEDLKTLFNVTLFYPRLIREREGAARLSPNNNSGSPRLSPIPSSSSSRSASPVGDRPKSPNPESRSRREKLRNLLNRKGKSAPTAGRVMDTDPDELRRWGFESAVPALVSLAVSLPLLGPNQPTLGPFGLQRQIITVFLNFNTAVYASAVYDRLTSASAPTVPSLPQTGKGQPPALPPLVARMLHLLDSTAERFIPFSPDDESAQLAVASAPESVDECLSFLLLLLAKFAAEDERGEVRSSLRQHLLAPDIDRTVGLEKRKDLTGRLVRLMSSTFMPSCSDASAKLLFALCDQDPAQLAATIGYGNASGFLQSINMLIPPGAVPETTSGDASSGDRREDAAAQSSSRPINPITGAYYDDEILEEVVQMTDEEKEREAERLFVLFDRINKTGAISVENPVSAAKQAGKLETSLSELQADRIKQSKEDEEEERRALDELQRYKDRKRGL